MSTDLEPCNFCGGHGMLQGDKLALWVSCTRCHARGPAVLKSRADATAQTIAAWNSGKRFGNLGVIAVPHGLTPAAASVAERLRLVTEAIYSGDYGTVQSAVLVLHAGTQAHTITHRISNADTLALLNAVRDAARVRASVALPKPHGS